MSNAQSQADSLPSGHVAPVVEIIAEREITTSANVVKFDLLQSKTYYAQDLGTYLDRKGLAQINMNGAPGTTATVRFRGTASDHTSIFWQGIPVNSVSLGMSDVSLIPVFMFDEALFFSDPNTSELASTNVSAAINLSQSRALQKDDSSLRLFSSYNSLNNFFSGIDFKLILPVFKNRNDNSDKIKPQLTWRTKFFHQTLRNNFSYTDNYIIAKPVVKQQHNDGINYGLMQELTLLWSSYSLSANLWYQDRKVELPSIMGKTLAGTSEQDDNFLRSSIALNYKKDKFSWSLSNAWIDEFQSYRDGPLPDGNWGIQSDIKSKGLFNHGKVAYKLSPSLLLQANAMSSYYLVDNVNYENSLQTLWWGQAGAGLVFARNQHTLRLDGRWDIRDSKTQPAWTLAYGYDFRIGEWRFMPQVQVGRRFRVPDLNERFWVPGGNKDLLPERGMTYKASFEVSAYEKSRVSVSFVPAVFYNDITNWIQWTPTTMGYFAPTNYKHVRSEGIELPVGLVYRTSKDLTLSASCRYSYTRARGVNELNWNEEQAFEMIYTPNHLVASELQLKFKGIGFSGYHKYTSSRYTDEQNSKLRALPAYHLLGASIDYNISLPRFNVYAQLGLDNMMDVQYESVRSYAMPGRVIQCSIQIEFITFKSNKSK